MIDNHATHEITDDFQKLQDEKTYKIANMNMMLHMLNVDVEEVSWMAAASVSSPLPFRGPIGLHECC